MLKYLLAATGVLIAVVLFLFFFPGPDKQDESFVVLRELSETAERLCLSNTIDTRSAGVKASLAAVGGRVEGEASAERRREAVLGAALSLPAAIKQTENDDVRRCMEPWGERIRDIAGRMAAAPRS